MLLLFIQSINQSRKRHPKRHHNYRIDQEQKMENFLFALNCSEKRKKHNLNNDAPSSIQIVKYL
ncbi:hypothetical protein DERP_009282 [Dermatophagoides pteronyssinus]|uniref:Uncharacterized protein n=1 Tax=Dermatophagoides pteronyssinus TaxID=6956 RepID=A0ABQ8ITD8_DERPT|nr:hypothetical protein DERP_009282 [Dermatophagoides pteronyssinus]